MTGIDRVRIVPSEPRGAFHEAMRRAPEYDEGSVRQYVSSKHDGRLEDCRAPECRAVLRAMRDRALGST